MRSAALLTLAGVGARVGATGPAVLHDVDLRVDAGECLGVVGASGAGKSTLVRVLLGLQACTGDLLWDGAPVPTSGAAARAFRRRVQYVPQDPAGSLDPLRPVGRSLREPLRALRVPGDHHARIAEALDRVGIDPALAARRPRELSGGQVQRVAIARTLAIGAEVVVADEPLSAVDRPRRALLLGLWEQVRAEAGLTLVLVSHDLPAVARLCTRVAVLDRGRVVEDGPTASILSAPAHAATRALVDAVPAWERRALEAAR